MDQTRQSEMEWRWSFSISDNSIYVSFFNRKSFNKMLLNNSCQIGTNLCVSPGSSSIVGIRRITLLRRAFLLGRSGSFCGGEAMEYYICLSLERLLMPNEDGGLIKMCAIIYLWLLFIMGEDFQFLISCFNEQHYGVARVLSSANRPLRRHSRRSSPDGLIVYL